MQCPQESGVKLGRSMPGKEPRAKIQQRGDTAEACWWLGSLGHVVGPRWDRVQFYALSFFDALASSLQNPAIKLTSKVPHVAVFTFSNQNG